MPNMNKFCIKPHIPEGEYGYTIPSSESYVSVKILLLYLLPELSLAALFTASIFDDSSNDVDTLQIFIIVSYFILSCFIPFKTQPISYTP